MNGHADEQGYDNGRRNQKKYKNKGVKIGYMKISILKYPRDIAQCRKSFGPPHAVPKKTHAYRFDTGIEDKQTEKDEGRHYKENAGNVPFAVKMIYFFQSRASLRKIRAPVQDGARHDPALALIFPSPFLPGQ
jgi:hypothetical protein